MIRTPISRPRRDPNPIRHPAPPAARKRAAPRPVRTPAPPASSPVRQGEQPYPRAVAATRRHDRVGRRTGRRCRRARRQILSRRGRAARAAGVRAGGGADPRGGAAAIPGSATLPASWRSTSRRTGCASRSWMRTSQPMFATGSAPPNDRARLLLQKVAPVLAKPDRADLDRRPYRRRAVSRSRTQQLGVVHRARQRDAAAADRRRPAEGRVRSVTGHADRDPLLPADPLAAANRRIAIVVLRRPRPRARRRAHRSARPGADAPSVEASPSRPRRRRSNDDGC